MPAAPWSVPSEAFCCARRPNSDQTQVSDAVGDPARLEVALEGEQRVGGELRARSRAPPACAGVRVELPLAR